MLLFILEEMNQTLTGGASFNTSHVVIYPNPSKKILAWRQSFNTSHVVIYRADVPESTIRQPSFNTSHVVIYQKKYPVSNKIILFQYISCCYLSEQVVRIRGL